MDGQILLNLRLLLQNRCGLYFKPEQEADFVKGVHQAMQASHFTNLEAYSQALRQLDIHDPLWKHLVEELTIGETYFYRNIWHMQALRDAVLPQLIQKRRLEKNLTLRIWSAGCSSGEEPYSLAILLYEMIPDLEYWTIHLLGTDINELSLNKAMLARYGGWSFRAETPYEIREKYFWENNGQYELVPEIRRMVKFEYLNLVEDPYPSPQTRTHDLDIVICRNVTIYFDRATTQRVVDGFYQCLVEGGWLIVGHSEPLASIYKAYEAHNFPSAVLYRRGKQTLVSPTKPKEQREFESPRHTVNEALTSTRPDVESLFLLAKMTADEGQSPHEVHKILDELDSVNPLVPQAHYLRALLHQQTHQFNDAKNALRRALYADRDFILAHYSMGELLYTEGNLVLAKRSWQNALNLLQKMLPHNPIPFGDGILAGTLMNAIEQRMKST